MRSQAAVILVLLLCAESALAIRGKQSNNRPEVWEDEDVAPEDKGWLNLFKHERHTHSNSDEDDKADNSFSLPNPPLDEVPDSSSAPPTGASSASPQQTTRSPASVQQPTPEELAACEAAAVGDVYKTDQSITVRFLYELLSPDDRALTEVAATVHEKVQDFLVDELVGDCDGRRPFSSIGGIGPGNEVDTVIRDSCSNLLAQKSETCHLMAASVVLYLFSSNKSYSDDEAYDPVSEKLRLAFNGSRRSLKTSFVDEDQGILGLYYIGDYVYEDNSASTGSGATTNVASIGSDDSSQSKTLSARVPVIIASSIMLACLLFTFVAVHTYKRMKSNKSKGILLVDDGSDEGSDCQLRKDKEEGKYSIQFSLVDTADESDSCSSGSAFAANERVMEDLSGMSLAESVSASKFPRPVFIDPDSVTYYSKARKIYTFERESARSAKMYTLDRQYDCTDTVEI